MTEKRWAASEVEAIRAVEDFMAALNAGDNKALFNTMHVPHVRISDDGVAIYATREDLEKNYLKGFAARAGESWHHTDLDWTQALHSSENKVHLFIQWTRYDKDDGHTGHPPSPVDNDQAQRPLGCSGAFQFRAVRVTLGKC